MKPLTSEHGPENPEVFECTQLEVEIALRSLAYHNAMRKNPLEESPDILAFQKLTDTIGSYHDLRDDPQALVSNLRLPDKLDDALGMKPPTVVFRPHELGRLGAALHLAGTEGVHHALARMRKVGISPDTDNGWWTNKITACGDGAFSMFKVMEPIVRRKGGSLSSQWPDWQA